MKSSDMMTMLAMAEGLAMSNVQNSYSRRSEYVRPSGATTTSKKKRKAQSKARKINQKKRKKK